MPGRLVFTFDNHEHGGVIRDRLFCGRMPFKTSKRAKERKMVLHHRTVAAAATAAAAAATAAAATKSFSCSV